MKKNQEKATKIVCTLGPASSKKQTIKKMIKAGMNVARLNFSHGTHQEHRERIETYRAACEGAGVPPALLLDTRGPEIRLGVFEEGSVAVKKGQQFILYGDRDAPGTCDGVGISYPALAKQVKPGDRLLIDDGKMPMEVKEVQKGNILCKAQASGSLGTKKGINVPDIHLDMEFLSENDKKDLLFGIRMDVDFVAASFVRCADDIRAMRSFLKKKGGGSIQIIAKIENPESIRNFDEILEVSDGIMIARGDMGVEVDFATLPGIQKEIIVKCNRAGKPVITATQMLESMISEPTPTRAEITDVANAVYDGTSAVMLSAESAAGKYPAEAVGVMTRILKQAEQDVAEGEVRFRDRTPLREPEQTDVSTAIGHGACQAAEDIGAKAILAITRSGYTARVMARFDPHQPIVAVTPEARTARQLALVKGVRPLIIASENRWEKLMDNALAAAKKKGLIKRGDRVVISAGLPLNVSGTTNMIRVITVD